MWSRQEPRRAEWFYVRSTGEWCVDQDPFLDFLLPFLVSGPRRKPGIFVSEKVPGLRLGPDRELRTYYLADRAALLPGAARQNSLDDLVRGAQAAAWDFAANGVGFALFEQQPPDLSAAALAQLSP